MPCVAGELYKHLISLNIVNPDLVQIFVDYTNIAMWPFCSQYFNSKQLKNGVFHFGIKIQESETKITKRKLK